MSSTSYILSELKGVGNVELQMQAGQRVYAFFGANGIGKTKCLEGLFQFLLLGSKRVIPFARHRLVGPEDFLVSRWTGSDGNQFDASSPTWFLKNAHKSGFPDIHDNPVVFLGASRRGHLLHQDDAAHLLGTFEQRRENYIEDIFDSMKGGFSSLGMKSDVESWLVTRAQSANPYQKKADNRKNEIDSLLQLLHEIDERFDPSFLEVAGDSAVSLKIDGRVTKLQHLSSGFASLFKILQSIIAGYGNLTNETQLTRVKGIVFIDEVESHLHNKWQAKIIPLLKRLFPHTTFYIASHSSLVLSQLQEGEAYLLKRESDGVVRSILIPAPNKRAFFDLLADAFDVDLNAMKLQRLQTEDQSQAKDALLTLLNRVDGVAR